MSVRLGLAYPLAKRGRTALILGMYSLVVFTLTFITVMSNLLSLQIDNAVADASGGADIRMTSNAANPVPAQRVTEKTGVVKIAQFSNDALEYQGNGNSKFDSWPTTAFGEDVVNGGAPKLAERDAQFATDQAAYQGVARNPSLAIVSSFFLQESGGPPANPFTVGDKFIGRDPLSGREQQFEVAGVMDSGFGDFSTFISRDAYRTLVGERAVTNLVTIDLAPATDTEAFVNQLNAQFIANGAKADSYRSIVETGMSQNRQFFQLMQGYLALGLIVGIAGLGVVMVRAVRERRRQIGMLRSLGFQSRAVSKAFLTESAFVALEGIVIGVALAIVVVWRFADSGEFGSNASFAVPWLQLAVLVLGTFVISLLATVAPARQASKILPAVALRLTD